MVSIDEYEIIGRVSHLRKVLTVKYFV